MEKENEQIPEWFYSTQGPQISTTLKAILGLLIPALKDLFGVEIGKESVDNLIDAALILGFAAWALYGHIRARKAMGSYLEKCHDKVKSLGGSVEDIG